jgi:hypothetical protein
LVRGTWPVQQHAWSCASETILCACTWQTANCKGETAAQSQAIATRAAVRPGRYVGSSSPPQSYNYSVSLSRYCGGNAPELNWPVITQQPLRNHCPSDGVYDINNDNMITYRPSSLAAYHNKNRTHIILQRDTCLIASTRAARAPLNIRRRKRGPTDGRLLAFGYLLFGVIRTHREYTATIRTDVMYRYLVFDKTMGVINKTNKRIPVFTVKNDLNSGLNTS